MYSGGKENAAYYSQQPNPSREYYSNNDQPWRNVSSVIYKWKLSFDSDTNESIKPFLIELDEKRKLSGISESEVLAYLPFLITGTLATAWRRSNSWHSWKQFYEDALYHFHCLVYNKKLVLEAYARTQGPDEPVVEYISKLGTLMQLQEPEPSLSAKIALLYKNMLPSLKQYVKLDEIKIESIEAFYLRAIKAERLLEKKRIDSSLFRGLEDLLSSKLKVQEARAQLPEEMEDIISMMIDENIFYGAWNVDLPHSINKTLIIKENNCNVNSLFSGLKTLHHLTISYDNIIKLLLSYRPMVH